MNIEFWNKHQSTQVETSINKLKQSHDEVLLLVDTFTNEELFTKKYYNWTGTASLGSYCISALSSHYGWAINKLRLHLKNCTNK